MATTPGAGGGGAAEPARLQIPHRVLIVDDAADVRLLLRAYLEPAYHVVGEATNGREAVTVAKELQPDLVVLDLAMPVMGGLEAITLLRTVAPDAKIVVLSALLPDPPSTAEGFGADVLLDKSCSPEELLDALGRILPVPELADGHALGTELDLDDAWANEFQREQLEGMRSTFVMAAVGMAIIGLDGRILDANPAFRRLTGRPSHELIGLNWRTLVHPDDAVRLGRTLPLGPEPQDHGEWGVVRPDGCLAWASVWSSVVTDPDGQPLYVLVQAQDVTRRREVEHQLSKVEERFRRAFDTSPIGMGLIDLAGSFSEVNPALCDLLGYGESELLATKLLDVTRVDHRRDVVNLFDILRGGDRRSYRAELCCIARGGRDVWVHLSVAVIGTADDDATTFCMAQFEDVTERKRAEAKLIHQSLHDPLTGLANRVLLADRLRQALARNDRFRGDTALLFLDLDRFKLVNDSFGHDVGDELLVEVGRRLSAAVRPADTVARLGGDEFVILAEGLDGIAGARVVADRLLNAVSVPCFVGGLEIVQTASIGIALAGDHVKNPEIMLRNADIAMYRAKDRGRNRFELFDDNLRARTVARVDIESAVRQALSGGGLRLEFQPIVDIRSEAIVAAEALVRIDDPVRGLLQPSEFIGVAEETGLIVSIGNWVLQEACRMWAALPPLPNGDPMKLSVNLSGVQLAMPGLAEDVIRVCKEVALEPSALCLELTETSLIEVSSSLSGSALDALIRAGVSLGIDDFGTGYSSLTYLRRFPVDFVKIDKSFVGGLCSVADDASIVEAVVGLARAMHVSTIAEGVETAEQADRLRALECDLAQGFYFAHPVPPEAFKDLLATSR